MNIDFENYKYIHKYALPELLKLENVASNTLSEFTNEVNSLKSVSAENKCLMKYSDSWVIDLTELDENYSISKKWAGSASCRANINSNKTNRFQVKRFSDSIDNYICHSKLKQWVPELKFIEYMKKFGDLRKVSIAALMPGGWWPAHYDFSSKNGYKLNLCISSNINCSTIVFNSQKKEFFTANLKPGDIYYVNVGMKHAAHNWGTSERIHILCTYATRQLK